MPREVPSLRRREVVKALGRLGFLSREGKSHTVFFHPSDSEDGFALPRHAGELKRSVVLKLLKWLEKSGITRDEFLQALK